jgi:hypothetical protein
MGIEIGSKKVGGGELGAFTEELGAGLEVGDTAVEVKVIALEGRKPGSNEGVDEIAAASNGLAKVMSPGGELGIRGKNVEGLAEVGGVSDGGRDEGEVLVNRGENFGVGKAEVDTVRGPPRQWNSEI